MQISGAKGIELAGAVGEMVPSSGEPDEYGGAPRARYPVGPSPAVMPHSESE